MLRLMLSLLVAAFAAMIANTVLKVTPFDANSVVNKTRDISTTNIKYTSIKTTNGVHLNTIEVGDRIKDKNKPLVVLLHGFPETALTCWHNQIDALADSGRYYILAPDMRGYNKSDKPGNFMDYHLINLISDVHSLIHDYAGREEAYLVAHDWGAIVAWRFAQTHPGSIKKLTIINVPHPAAAGLLVKHGSWSQVFSQMWKSWYIAFFQLPNPLPEYRFTNNNYSTLKAALRDLTSSGKISELELQRYVQGWSEPGAVTSMMNYYRGFLMGNLYGTIKDKLFSTNTYSLPPTTDTIKKPTMLIWGEQDLALEFALAGLSYDYGVDESVKSQSRFVPLAGVSHFATNDAPERVNELLLEYLN
ncbi:yfhM [Acrasis kona]|uniref:YfhM n=1 Tax=Acrasis kona TaxID=1008807 RepID=A0AAW2YSC4_9EUKA